MIKSMTGYGTGSIKLPSSNLNLELKSLNSRNLDIRFSGLSLGAELEEKIRLILSSRLQRGSIKVFIDFDKNTKDKSVFFDEDNFKSIMQLLVKIEKKYNQKLDLNNLVNINDLFKSKDIEITDDKKTVRAFKKALDQLDKTRIFEGKQIQKDLIKRLRFIKKDVQDMKKLTLSLKNKRKKEISDKIRFYIEQDSIDDNRLMQEVAYIIERSDITEEIVRVNIHIDSFLKYLKSKEPVGKRLGFLTQEINREVNTIGSKSPLPKVTEKVVEIKNELEKIREQLQNIL
jgi:uncharacterized protein (TIGR00255 family)